MKPVHYYHLICSTLGVLIVSIAAPAYAQLRAPATVGEEVVVTATRFKEPQRDTPIGVTVISAEQIRANTASSVPDCSCQFPGVPCARQLRLAEPAGRHARIRHLRRSKHADPARRPAHQRKRADHRQLGGDSAVRDRAHRNHARQRRGAVRRRRDRRDDQHHHQGAGARSQVGVSRRGRRDSTTQSDIRAGFNIAGEASA